MKKKTKGGIIGSILGIAALTAIIFNPVILLYIVGIPLAIMLLFRCGK
jgi:hypothetical protein